MPVSTIYNFAVHTPVWIVEASAITDGGSRNGAYCLRRMMRRMVGDDDDDDADTSTPRWAN